MMDRVYSRATRVFAWVGKPGAFSIDAKETIEAIAEAPEDIWDGGKVTLSSFPGVDLVCWFALYAFFQRSWFRRAWVVQETTFGGDRVSIIHDTGAFDWGTLARLAQRMRSCGLVLEIVKLGRKLCRGWGLSDSVVQVLELCQFGNEEGQTGDMRKAYAQGQDGLSFVASIWDQMWRFKLDAGVIYAGSPPLIRVLSMFRGTDATDPRDKVFGFLNLACDTKDLQLVPNYEDSVQHAFILAKVAIMFRSQSLSILSQIQEPCDTRVKGLMGWVPDFSAHPRCIPLDDGEDDVVYAASGRDTKALLFAHGDGALEVESIMVDKVITTTIYEEDNEDMVLNMLKLVIRTPHDYPLASFATTGGHDNGEPEIASKFLGRRCDSDDWFSNDEDKDEEAEGDVEDLAKLQIQDQTPSTQNNQPKYRIDSTTRIEALWRSLVANMLPVASRGYHLEGAEGAAYPAPPSLGHGFSNWMMAHMLEMWHIFHRYDVGNINDESSDHDKETRRQDNEYQDPD